MTTYPKNLIIMRSTGGFTILHKLALLENKYPELIFKFKKYLIKKDFIGTYNGTIRRAAESIINGYVDKVNDIGLTALHLASSANSIEMAKILLNNSANVNIKSKDCSTPLLFASGNTNDITLVKLLIENGADVNIENNHGLTPLIRAIEYSLNSYATVKLLLENGANIHIKDKCGYSALSSALFHCIVDIKVIKLLLEYDDKTYDNIDSFNNALENCCTMFLIDLNLVKSKLSTIYSDIVLLNSKN